MSKQKNSPRQLVLCFQVHQPRRLKVVHDPAQHHAPRFDDMLDRTIMERISSDCYLPVNAMLLKRIEQYPQLKIAFSISGLALVQMEQFAPAALESFRQLTDTGCVDMLAEPHYHSMAFLMESEEFEIQILEHTEKLVEYFNVHPWVFRNPALFYSDDIGRRIHMMGFQGLLTEGTASALRANKPHNLYEHRDQNGLTLFLRNPNLSDDIAYRVACPEWELSAEKFMSWLEAMPDDERVVVISLDYETFAKNSGDDHQVTLSFLEDLLLLLAMQNDYKMVTPSEVVQTRQVLKPISIPDYISVRGCSLSDWFGNDRQRDAFAAMLALEHPLKSKNDPALLKEWRILQACDHFYYMADRSTAMSPYSSADEAYHTYMAALQDLKRRLEGGANSDAEAEKRNDELETERRSLHDPTWAMSIDQRQTYLHG